MEEKEMRKKSSKLNEGTFCTTYFVVWMIIFHRVSFKATERICRFFCECQATYFRHNELRIHRQRAGDKYSEMSEVHRYYLT